MLIGSADHTADLSHQLQQQGLNAWRVLSAGEVSAADKASVKACVVCQTANAQAAQHISQGLSRMGIGPLWVLVQGDAPQTPTQAKGKYEPQQLVRDLADTLADIMPLSGGQCVAKVYAPHALAGQTLDASHWPARLGVTLLGVQTPGQACEASHATWAVAPGDCLVVTGPLAAVQTLARQPLLLVDPSVAAVQTSLIG